MKSNQKIARITGILFLFVFISGIIIFQVLQGSILFSENFIAITSQNSNKIISSTLLGIINGIVSIVIATMLLPIFKRYNYNLAHLYLAFCILNFIAIMLDNISVVSMLELSNEYVRNGNDSSLKVLETFVYQKHRWTHYFYLLISCFPVFILYYVLYLYKLIPRVLSIFGLFAVLLMFIEELLSTYGQGISMDLLLPMALIQLTLPLWLIFKGLNSPASVSTY
ncbi:DUF4386 domain-containing protein [Formosa sp. 3Alg 14/1]|uniref:DUF4386 domain-containing protein n=1 Tax=Formosa sp. 3Alg 14/1 TaxID=3382190 RepID=UPI0039BEAF04